MKKLNLYFSQSTVLSIMWCKFIREHDILYSQVWTLFKLYPGTSIIIEINIRKQWLLHVPIDNLIFCFNPKQLFCHSMEVCFCNKIISIYTYMNLTFCVSLTCILSCIRDIAQNNKLCFWNEWCKCEERRMYGRKKDVRKRKDDELQIRQEWQIRRLWGRKPG